MSKKFQYKDSKDIAQRRAKKGRNVKYITAKVIRLPMFVIVVLNLYVNDAQDVIKISTCVDCTLN